MHEIETLVARGQYCKRKTFRNFKCKTVQFKSNESKYLSNESKCKKDSTRIKAKQYPALRSQSP